MFSRIAVLSVLIIQLLLHLKFPPSHAQSWVQSAYWRNDTGFPISDINSTLFTHLICAFADVNSSSYELYVDSANEHSFSNFTTAVKQKNPSITTLLSIGGGRANPSVLSSMVSTASSRKSFIQSSIRIARSYGFQGLDLSWVFDKTISDMNNMGSLFQEWREAAKSEAKNTGHLELILTAAVHYTPELNSVSYPVKSITSNLNWVHVMAYDYYMPQRDHFTGSQAALFDPSSDNNTDYGIKQWIGRGIPASQLVLALPYYGYVWNLTNPKDNAIGAPARAPTTGPTSTLQENMRYKDIKAYIKSNGATELYNATYVVNYCLVGSIWIGFDGVDAVKRKVSYARENKLLGYYAWVVSGDDDNWALSTAAGKEQIVSFIHILENRDFSVRLVSVL